MSESQSVVRRQRILGIQIGQGTRWIVYRFVRNPNFAFGVVVLVAMSTLAVFAPLVDRTDPLKLSPYERLQAPSAKHWFGTDPTGRDLYSRTVHGARLSLLVGFSVVIAVSIVGGSLGLITGYSKRIDNVLMRFMDGLMAFPTLVLALALIALLGSSIQNVIIAITVVDSPRMVRIVRSSVLSLREQTFIEAVRAVGAPTWRILLVHIAPNTLAPVLVQVTFIFAGAIMTEASLSFLGAGSPPHIPSWGNLISQGRDYLQIALWMILFPGLFLGLTVLAVNLVGDAIRDALDPKLRRRL
ncbi:MAG: ABC transporter permease [candidate division WOR-3 bacterium]